MGEYTLTEEHAPDGYIKTLKPVKFTVGRDGIVTYTNAVDNPAPIVTPYEDNKQYIVQNVAGAPLPSTGGSGTVFSSVLGAVLVTMAGTALVLKRRRETI